MGAPSELQGRVAVATRSRLLWLLGLGVALGSGAAVLALVVVPLIGVLIRILHEERTLRMALGAEYDAYTARTPRLIPSIW